LAQIVGSKYVRLYSPEETEKVYPRGVEAGGVDMSNTSEVDIEGSHELLENFPKLKDAKYQETVLGEGEALFIPVSFLPFCAGMED
jgi:lysine-specific demethylase 8